jgi:D-glycero-D-manno-heptose 1,7-bisphosphate phosphatase
MKKRPAIFLDRDGVIIEEVNYLSHPDQIRLIPGSAEAISLLNQLHIPVVVVSNQAGVARGFFEESAIPKVHSRLKELLVEKNAHWDEIFYCPHHPNGNIPKYAVRCTCRKPEPGMLIQAAQLLNLTLTNSWLIGDNISDIQAGLSVGCRTILVETGHGKQFALETPKPTTLKKNLAEAVKFIFESNSFPKQLSA